MNYVRTKKEIQTNKDSMWSTFSTSSAVTLLLPDPDGKHKNYKFDLTPLLMHIYNRLDGRSAVIHGIKIQRDTFDFLCNFGNIDGYHDVGAVEGKLLHALLTHTALVLRRHDSLNYFETVSMFSSVRSTEDTGIDVWFSDDVGIYNIKWGSVVPSVYYPYIISDNLSIRSPDAKKLHAVLVDNLTEIDVNGMFISMESIAKIMGKKFEAQANTYEKEFGIHSPSSLVSYVNRAVASINRDTKIPKVLGRLIFTQVRFKGDGKSRLEGYEVMIGSLEGE